MRRRFLAEYCSVQMTYMMIYAVLGTFASVFLLGNGYNNTEIGVIMAVANIFTVVLSPLLADFADRTKRFQLTDFVLAIAIGIGLMNLVMLLFPGHSPLLFAVYFLAIGLHGFFQPLVNTMNFRIAAHGYPLNYGLTRALGSLGFAVTTSVLGKLIDRFGIPVIPLASEVCVVLLVIATLLIMGTFKKARAQAEAGADPFLMPEHEEEEITLGKFIKNNIPFVILNLGVLLGFYHQFVITSFLIQVITPLGGDSVHLGRLLAIQAIVEVPVMMSSGLLLKKFTSRQLMRFSMVGYVLKPLLLFLAKDLTLVYIGMACQMVGFALFYPAVIDYIGTSMSKGEAVKGQSVFSMMMMAAGIVANFSAGPILDNAGVRPLLLVSLITCILGSLIVILMADKAYKKKD